MMSYGAFDLDGAPDVMRRKRFFPMGRFRDGKLLPVDPAKITEDVAASWYRGSVPLHPTAGETVPDPHKEDGYTWLKAPRYEGEVYEVGPLARAVIARASGANPALTEAIDRTLAQLRLKEADLYSVLGRHLARAVETKVVADAMADWVLQIKLDEPVATPFTMPEEATGFGLWDASRGALGHWIAIRNKRIARYQAVVPTTWNASPRDARGTPGAMEQALTGAVVKDASNPFTLARIVRSFDPCIACAVHAVTARGALLGHLRAV